MAKLYECETCAGKVSENAKACPHCGEIYYKSEKPVKIDNRRYVY